VVDFISVARIGGLPNSATMLGAAPGLERVNGFFKEALFSGIREPQFDRHTLHSLRGREV